MRLIDRLQKILFVAVLAVFGVAMASAGNTAQASAAVADVCADRYGCPGGPDFCLTITFKDGSKLTCYKTAKPLEDKDTLGHATPIEGDLTKGDLADRS
jgi:hypothetical protein